MWPTEPFVPTVAQGKLPERTRAGVTRQLRIGPVPLSGKCEEAPRTGPGIPKRGQTGRQKSGHISQINQNTETETKECPIEPRGRGVPLSQGRKDMAKIVKSYD